MNKVLFLQSWFSKISDNWYPWLEQELKKKGYETYFPDIAEFRKDTPDLSVIINEINELNILDKDTTVIGHSLGALVAMRLAERYSYKKMITVSGWDYDDLTEGHKLFWQTKMNHHSIKNNVSEIAVVHSDNDPYVTAIISEEMSNRLNGKFVLVKNAGHFLSADGITEVPQILELM